MPSPPAARSQSPVPDGVFSWANASEWSAPASVRVLSSVNLLAAAIISGLITHDLIAYGIQSPGAGGMSAFWVTLSTFVVAPALLLSWLGVGLWRLDRAAYVLQVALACLLVPVFGIGVVYLAVLLPKATRWQFGIGPDEVLAEVEARQEVTFLELTQRFQVPPKTLRLLLEQAHAHGAFVGGIDRQKGIVYSADAMALRAELKRCPPCGGALKATGALAHCPYCGTEFAKYGGGRVLTPFPTGLAVLSALDRLLAYLLAFVALIWILIYQDLDWSGMTVTDILYGYVLLALLPLAAVMLLLWVANSLPRGRPWAYVAQGLLLPPSLPYLLRRKVRLVFGFGLTDLSRDLAQAGELTFDALARSLGLTSAHAPDVAVFLTASGRLPGVIDWGKRRIVSRTWLERTESPHCLHCGAPDPLVGDCRYCGTDTSLPLERPKDVDAPRVSPLGRGVLDRVTALVMVAVWGGGAAIGALAVDTRDGQQETASSSPTPVAPSLSTLEVGQRLPSPVESKLAGAFIPVERYEPERRETFLEPSVTSLAFSSDGKILLSGEANGVFLWEIAKGRPVLRTPVSWHYAGVSRIRFGLEGALVLRPYYESLLWGTTSPWSLSTRSDLEKLEKHLDEATVADVGVRRDGGVTIVFRKGAAFIAVDASTWRMTARGEIEAGSVGRTRLSEGAGYLAVVPTDGEVKLEVWDLVDQKRVLKWVHEGIGLFGLSIKDVAFIPGSRLLAVSCTEGLVILEPVLRERVKTFDVQGLFEPMEVSPDGSCVVASGAFEGELEARDFRFRVYSLRAGEKVVEVSGHRGWIQALAFSPDGRTVASGDSVGRVRWLSLGALCGTGRPEWLEAAMK